MGLKGDVSLRASTAPLLDVARTFHSDSASVLCCQNMSLSRAEDPCRATGALRAKDRRCEGAAAEGKSSLFSLVGFAG